MRGEDGVVPERFANVKAPLLLVRQLKENLISKISWEQVVAELYYLRSQPLPARVVQAFSDDSRYNHMDYEHDVKEVGGKTLSAWGLNDSEVRKGSFEKLVEDHYKDLRSVRHLQDQPRIQALTNPSWGTFPRLWAAIKSAEENTAQIMNMLPGQIVVDGSTTKVARSLIPFVVDNSPYYGMRDMAAKEKAATLEERVMHKHLFLRGAEAGKRA